MARFVLDRIGFLKPGEYRFSELASGETEAKAWLGVYESERWRYYVEDPKILKHLEQLADRNPLPTDRKEVALPVLGPKDVALIIYRDPVPGTKPETKPSRVQDPWRYGLLSGSKLS